MATGNGALRDLGRALSWHRRLLAAALAAASVALGLHAAEPAPDRTVTVLTAAHDLRGGSRLSASDLTTAPLPPEVVPDGAVRAGDSPVGRVLAAPMRAGEPLTDRRLVGRSLLASYGAHVVGATVRLADAGTIALLRAGDHVDVLAASTEAGEADEPAREVARDVTVLTVPRPEASTPSGSGLIEGGLVVLAVRPGTAADLARAQVTSRLSAVLRGPPDPSD